MYGCVFRERYTYINMYTHLRGHVDVQPCRIKESQLTWKKARGLAVLPPLSGPIPLVAMKTAQRCCCRWDLFASSCCSHFESQQQVASGGKMQLGTPFCLGSEAKTWFGMDVGRV